MTRLGIERHYDSLAISRNDDDLLMKISHEATIYTEG